MSKVLNGALLVFAVLVAVGLFLGMAFSTQTVKGHAVPVDYDVKIQAQPQAAPHKPVATTTVQAPTTSVTQTPPETSSSQPSQPVTTTSEPTTTKSDTSTTMQKVYPDIAKFASCNIVTPGDLMANFAEPTSFTGTIVAPGKADTCYYSLSVADKNSYVSIEYNCATDTGGGKWSTAKAEFESYKVSGMQIDDPAGSYLYVDITTPEPMSRMANLLPNGCLVAMTAPEHTALLDVEQAQDKLKATFKVAVKRAQSLDITVPTS